MRNVLLVSLLMLGSIAFAQTTVKGKVVDQNDNPVLGANVVIVGKSVGTVTDFDGNFTLETSEVPPFQLKITSLGYSDGVADVTSNNQTLSIVVSEAQTFLDEVVLSASRTPERIFESPVSVERFGLKEIANTTAASFYSGLENLKGVDVNTNSLTFQSVNTRGFAGFANNRFVQLVDGQDNSAPGLNFVVGNLVGTSELDIQSVEILPGASSALYGAGAFNGILFMRTKSPFDFQGISTYFKTGLTSQEAAGENAYYDFGIRAAHAFNDKFAVKVNFTYLNGEDWHAVRTDDINNPGATRDDPGFDGLNIYGDEVATTLNFDTLAGLPSGTLGSEFVSRTGYAESDLIDYTAESVKFDGSIHYRPFADDLEIIWNSRVGRGNTIFQATNRNVFSNFIIQQHKLEIRNDNFFVRGYLTAEGSGDSYDSRFTGINVNRAFKGDTEWFTDYATTFIGASLGVGTGVPVDETTAHALARASADSGRFVPGTAQFESAFNTVIENPDFASGSKFIDNSKLRHVDVNYNFSHITKDFADIQLGGSVREYELDSEGTVFTDNDGPISYTEFGAYVQAQRKLIDDRLKITASLRYDKNEFFDSFFSPRLGLGYTLGEKKNHNIRASVQTGFRNPTTQDLFIGLDAGAAILVGSAPTNPERFEQTFNVSADGTAATGLATSTLSGTDAYENAFSLSSIAAGAPEAINTNLVQPEEILAFEVGYRGQIGKIGIDLNAYYNNYDNFISNTTVLVPLYGQAGDNALSLLALQNGDFQPFQTRTNSLADVESYGATIGVDMKLFGNFDFGVNYTYAEFELDETQDPDFEASFNTPKHKVKASFGNTEVFKNVGFNVNYRWSDSYLWEATFADGNVPAFTVLDAQINFGVPVLYDSVFKIGASNLLNEEYFTAVGTGNVGSIYYVSWSINP